MHPDRDADVWSALRDVLPGLRRPAGQGLERRAVAALLARIEAEVTHDVGRAFEWESDGTARLLAGSRTYRAGCFETPRLSELETRIGQRGTRGAVTLSVLLGNHWLTDIGALQALAGPGTLFQVASQFNCLEAPGPSLARIPDYVHDNTQGPRASVSAFPGTFLRHYAAPAPDGTRFAQTHARQVNLLADAIDPDTGLVLNGYLRAGSVADPARFERALTAAFEKIRVGVHEGVEVVLGRNWGGPVEPAHTIAQVFTSTMAMGGYSAGIGDEFTGACTRLLRAAYLGTLLAALDLGSRAAVLTLVGGGAFGNPLRSIWDALVWAVDRAAAIAPSDLTVVVNARVMGPAVPREEIAEAVRAKNGALVYANADTEH